MIKQDIDNYFNKKYNILESTTTKIIKKHNRDLDSSTVIAMTYLHLIKIEQQIIDFAFKNNKTIEHTIYAFYLTYINSAIYWNNSKINAENDELHNITEKYPEEIDYNTEQIDYNTEQINNIYDETFITKFYNSLSKLDSICFKVYYYDNINNAKDFAEHFNISICSAYNTINKLKKLLIQFVKINNIY